jgi:hypothetical protein
MGDSTHHQDQSIKLVSFRAMKRIVSSPTKLTPELEDSFDMIDILRVK